LFNADFFNVFIHPNNVVGAGSAGILDLTNSGQAARAVQLGLRLIW